MMRIAIVLALVGVGCSGSQRSRPVATSENRTETTDRLAATPASAKDPGVATVDEVLETIHGVTVRDPYRWMEAGGPALDAFLDAQAARAKKVLAAIPGRDQMRDAIHAANLGVTRVWVAGVTGSIAKPRVFLMKRAPEENQAQLWVRDTWTGKDRLLVDPRTRDTGDTHYSLDYATPSPDGKHVAYGISASGSEDSTIEIINVDTLKVLPEKIDRAQYAHIDWRDAKSFFYWRRRMPAPGDTKADWFKNAAAYLHVLGQDPEKAVAVMSPMMKELGIGPEEFTVVDASPRSPWAIGIATPGTSADPSFFVAPLAKVVPGTTVPWRRLTGPKDQVVSMTARGNTLYALTYAGASRFRIVALDARKGTLATARELVAEGKEVLEGFVAAEDAMYLQLLDGGITRVDRVSWDGKRRQRVPLPYVGAAYIEGDADRPGIRFTQAGWTRSPRDYAYDVKAGVRDLELEEKWPIDYSHVTSKEVEVTSADGTKVPLSIIHRGDLKLDGSAPALLSGYQAYGLTDKPYFSPIRLAWVDRGAVFAVCHGRGNGDRGKQWHLAGTKHNKENGVDDFIACAEYLVANKYTSSSRLAVTGTSAGGILAGGAITKRPDLYAVGLLRVPVLNLVRFEHTEGGPANIPEFGALADPEDFKHLLASDPYHRVKDGTKYPALLITGGRHDVRVPVWMPAKFTARVQAATASDKPVLFRVESDAGHGIGSTRAQIEEEWADLYAFALWQSGAPIARP